MTESLAVQVWQWATTQGPWAVATLGVSWACMRLYRDSRALDKDAKEQLLNAMADAAAERATLVTKLNRAVKRAKAESEDDAQ